MEKTVRPIIFSAAMVLAILKGQKTQTRRPVVPIPSPPVLPGISFGPRGCEVAFGPTNIQKDGNVKWWLCPFGSPGDKLWVREAWRFTDLFFDGDIWSAAYEFRADGHQFQMARHFFQDDDPYIKKPHSHAPINLGWRPSIHMPHEASRISLVVEDVWVKRLQEMSNNDAESEGVMTIARITRDYKNPVERFAELWDSLYKKPGVCWEDNPMVWGCDFKIHSIRQ